MISQDPEQRVIAGHLPVAESGHDDGKLVSRGRLIGVASVAALAALAAGAIASPAEAEQQPAVDPAVAVSLAGPGLSTILRPEARPVQPPVVPLDEQIKEAVDALAGPSKGKANPVPATPAAPAAPEANPPAHPGTGTDNAETAPDTNTSDGQPASSIAAPANQNTLQNAANALSNPVQGKANHAPAAPAAPAAPEVNPAAPSAPEENSAPNPNSSDGQPASSIAAPTNQNTLQNAANALSNPVQGNSNPGEASSTPGYTEGEGSAGSPNPPTASPPATSAQPEAPGQGAQPESQNTSPATPETAQPAPSKYNSGHFKLAWEMFLNDPDLKLSKVGVAALMGNFAEETAGTMAPDIIQGGARDKDLPAAILGKLGYGWAQATSEDRQLHICAIAARMNLPAGDPRVQFQFIKEELMSRGYAELLDELRRYDDPAELPRLTALVEKIYERAGVPALSVRHWYAERIFHDNVGGPSPQVREAPTPSEGVPGNAHIAHQLVAGFAKEKNWIHGRNDENNSAPWLMKYTGGAHEAWCAALVAYIISHDTDMPDFHLNVRLGGHSYFLPRVSDLYNWMLNDHNQDFYVYDIGQIKAGKAGFKAGDVIFFNYADPPNPENVYHNGEGNHVGIITKVLANGNLVVGSGNESNTAGYMVVSPDSNTIAAISRPIYQQPSGEPSGEGQAKHETGYDPHGHAHGQQNPAPAPVSAPVPPQAPAAGAPTAPSGPAGSAAKQSSDAGSAPASGPVSSGSGETGSEPSQSQPQSDHEQAPTDGLGGLGDSIEQWVHGLISGEGAGTSETPTQPSNPGQAAQPGSTGVPSSASQNPLVGAGSYSN